jgi:hypothetical protein
MEMVRIKRNVGTGGAREILGVGSDRVAQQGTLAFALGLGDGGALGDIRTRLHARGQDDLAGLLPDEQAGSAEELLEQLIGLGG